MKTAIEMCIDELSLRREISKGTDHYYSYENAIYIVKMFLVTEKQQHEQTAIHITNVLMDALDNPKGGKFSGEDEFNNYWESKYGSTNKETLK